MTEALTEDCRTILSGISAYLDGDLDRTACDAIEEHCLHCARCAGVVNGLRETVGLCRQIVAVPLPETVRQRARDNVRRLLGDASASDGVGGAPGRADGNTEVDRESPLDRATQAAPDEHD